VQAGKLTLDLTNMRAVQLGARGIATIGPGAKLGPIHLVSRQCLLVSAAHRTGHHTWQRLW
jgi:hypothetical protein